MQPVAGPDRSRHARAPKDRGLPDCDREASPSRGACGGRVTYDCPIARPTHRSRQAARAAIDLMLAPVERALDRRRGRTSVTDNGAYPRLCDLAASEPAVCASFKRHPDYTPVLEHVTPDEGAEYLGITLAQTPSFAALLDRFRENDRLGTPHVSDYGSHGSFSPTTLRYVKVMSDLVKLFGSLDGFRIIEIGCGYGGQCFTVHVASKPRAYTLVDLEPCLRLQEVYLAELGVPTVSFVPPERVVDDATYDLVISNYAFSECTRDVQDEYLEGVLRNAKRGYLTCNWIAPRHFHSLSPDDLLAAVPGSRLLPETPTTAPDNRIWVWGDDGGSPPTGQAAPVEVVREPRS